MYVFDPVIIDNITCINHLMSLDKDILIKILNSPIYKDKMIKKYNELTINYGLNTETIITGFFDCISDDMLIESNLDYIYENFRYNYNNKQAIIDEITKTIIGVKSNLTIAKNVSCNNGPICLAKQNDIQYNRFVILNLCSIKNLMRWLNNYSDFFNMLMFSVYLKKYIKVNISQVNTDIYELYFKNVIYDEKDMYTNLSRMVYCAILPFVDRIDIYEIKYMLNTSVFEPYKNIHYFSRNLQTCKFDKYISEYTVNIVMMYISQALTKHNIYIKDNISLDKIIKLLNTKVSFSLDKIAHNLPCFPILTNFDNFDSVKTNNTLIYLYKNYILSIQELSHIKVYAINLSKISKKYNIIIPNNIQYKYVCSYKYSYELSHNPGEMIMNDEPSKFTSKIEELNKYTFKPQNTDINNQYIISQFTDSITIVLPDIDSYYLNLLNHLYSKHKIYGSYILNEVPYFLLENDDINKDINKVNNKDINKVNNKNNSLILGCFSLDNPLFNNY